MPAYIGWIAMFLIGVMIGMRIEYARWNWMVQANVIRLHKIREETKWRNT